jgi:predicted RecA/RadA family phage recombinase
MLGFYKSGDQIDYYNTSTAIAAGDVVEMGRILGIAVNDIAATTGTGPVQVKGIVKVTKTASQAWTQGQAIYCDAGTFTSTASGNFFAGVAACVAESGASLTTGYVLLNATGPAADSYTAPEITSGLEDSNGNMMIGFTTASTAVDYVNITNAAANGLPVIAAAGTDTHIDLIVAQKGTAFVQLGTAACSGVKLAADQPILDSAGLELISFGTTAAAVNEIKITNKDTGIAPIISSSGETHIGLDIAANGTGVVRILGKPCLGSSSAATLSFFGTTGATQAACVAACALSAATQATTTEIRALSVAVDAVIAAIKSYRAIATA